MPIDKKITTKMVRIKPLPISPRPHKDEVLYSWIARIASVYNLCLSNLLYYMGWSGSDINYNPTINNIQALARMTNYPATKIQRMALKNRYPLCKASDAFGHADFDTFRLPPMFCPECFIKDIMNKHKPYWRHQWATIWKAQCHIHHTPLNAMDNIVYDYCFLTPTTHIEVVPYAVDKFHFYTWSSNNDALLSRFETAIDKALCGIPPGDKWWMGASPKWFMRIAHDISPLLLIRAHNSICNVIIPYESILYYLGIEPIKFIGRGLHYYEKDALVIINDIERYNALLVLSRLMCSPMKCPVKKGEGVLVDNVDDIMEVLTRSLSIFSCCTLFRLIQKWPQVARDRVQRYLPSEKELERSMK